MSKNDFTDEIVCPYCGYEYSDSWGENDDKLDCQKCGETFHYEKELAFKYRVKQ